MMNKLQTKLVLAAALVTASAALWARDIGPDEVVRLVEAGTIQAPAKLNEAALAVRPGTTVQETELEEEHGLLVYQVDLRDETGAQWELELDAKTGKVLSSVEDRD